MGALPRIRSIISSLRGETPPPFSSHHAVLGLPLQPKAELSDLRGNKRTAGEGGGSRQRMRGGTAQVDSFRISAAHNGRDTFTVMKARKTKQQKTLLVSSIIGDVNSGTLEINLGPKSKQLIQLKIKKGPSFESFFFFDISVTFGLHDKEK